MPCRYSMTACGPSPRNLGKCAQPRFVGSACYFKRLVVFSYFSTGLKALYIFIRVVRALSLSPL